MEINIVNFLLALESKYGFYIKEMKTMLLIHSFSSPCTLLIPIIPSPGQWGANVHTCACLVWAGGQLIWEIYL